MSLAGLPFALIPPEFQVWVYGLAIAFVLGVLPTIKAALDIIAYFRGNPPASEKFVTKVELKDQREVFEKELRRVEQGIQRTESAIFQQLADLKGTTAGIAQTVQTMSRDWATLAAKLAHVEGALGE